MGRKLGGGACGGGPSGAGLSGNEEWRVNALGAVRALECSNLRLRWVRTLPEETQSRRLWQGRPEQLWQIQGTLDLGSMEVTETFTVAIVCPRAGVADRCVDLEETPSGG